MVFVFHICSDTGPMSTILWINLWVHLNSAISAEGGEGSLDLAAHCSPASTDTSNPHLLEASEGRLYEGASLFLQFQHSEPIRLFNTVCHAECSLLLPDERRKEVLASILGEQSYRRDHRGKGVLVS